MSVWDKLVNDDQYWHILEVLEKIAKDHGMFYYLTLDYWNYLYNL